MKKLMLITAVGCAVLVAASCNNKEQSSTEIKAESVTVDRDTLDIKVGEVVKLTAKVLPENSTQKTIKWSTTNVDVATIDAEGHVKPIAAGNCWVLAEAGDVLGGTYLNVSPADVHYIDEFGVDRGIGILIVGETGDHEYLKAEHRGITKSVIWAPVNCGYDEKHPAGRLYQWGRKKGIDTNAGKATMWTLGNGDEDANTFYKAGSGTFANDWIKNGADNWWNAGTVDNPKKGAFDPCPEGWRVPTVLEFFSINAAGQLTEEVAGVKGTWYSGSTPLEKAGKNKIFLPQTGYLKYSDGSFGSSGYGMYWVSTLYDAAKPYYARLKPAPDGYPYRDPRADAMAIRCVQIQD